MVPYNTDTNYLLTAIPSMNSFYRKNLFVGIYNPSFEAIALNPIQSKNWNIFLKLTTYNCITHGTVKLTHSEKHGKRNLNHKVHYFQPDSYAYTWWILQSSLGYIIHEILNFLYHVCPSERKSYLFGWVKATVHGKIGGKSHHFLSMKGALWGLKKKGYLRNFLKLSP